MAAFTLRLMIHTHFLRRQTLHALSALVLTGVSCVAQGANLGRPMRAVGPVRRWSVTEAEQDVRLIGRFHFSRPRKDPLRRRRTDRHASPPRLARRKVVATKVPRVARCLDLATGPWTPEVAPRRTVLPTRDTSGLAATYYYRLRTAARRASDLYRSTRLFSGTGPCCGRPAAASYALAPHIVLIGRLSAHHLGASEASATLGYDGVAATSQRMTVRVSGGLAGLF